MIKHPIMDFHHLSLRNFLGTQWLESIYFSNKPLEKKDNKYETGVAPLIQSLAYSCGQ